MGKLPAIRPVQPQPELQQSPLPMIEIAQALAGSHPFMLRQLVLAAGPWPTAALGFSVGRSDSLVVIVWSMTGFTTSAGQQITGTLTVDGTYFSTTKLFMNEANSHKTLPFGILAFGTANKNIFDVSLVDGLGIGPQLSVSRHSWILSISGTGAGSDGNDRVWAATLEFPQS